MLVTPGFALPQPGGSTERITSFDSWIEVDSAGAVKVVETITVIATGDKIRRGIYRDFPTDYITEAGVRVRVGFTVLDVQRDGKSESFHTTRMANGTRVYMGRSDVFLEPGTYSYTIIYQTDRQVGFFSDYDELYWNVTGTDWEFPIDEASAMIILPREAMIRQHSVYTGRQGSTASEAETTVVSGNEIRFQTTRGLLPNEGLTIAVAWQKGVVRQPDLRDEAVYFVRDNLFLLFSVLGLALLGCYYILIWHRVGRDPEPEAIIPRFEPPEGYTPAAGRFIMRMRFDNKSFAAALVNMAVKKYLRIENDEGDFTLERLPGADETVLSRGERQIAGKLFAGSDSLVLKQSNHSTIRASINALKRSLQTDFEKLHFTQNSRYMAPGLVVTVLVIGLLFLAYRHKETALFLSVWLTGWTVGCYFLFLRVHSHWRDAASGTSGLADTLRAVLLSLFSLPFATGWVFGFWMFVAETSLAAVSCLAGVLGLNVLFYHLLKAPTIPGRAAMDKLEGLKMYLSVAEKDRLNLLNPPEKTPELFEKLLPWALALDVEQEWSEQFSDILARAAEQGEYAPVWYTDHHRFNPASLASSLGTSLAGSIASSSTAPGSSSGSGGGGSSGGGGGGGGGGGW